MTHAGFPGAARSRIAGLLLLVLVASACAGESGDGAAPAQPSREPLPLDQQVITIAYGPDTYAAPGSSGTPNLGRFPLYVGVTEGLVNLRPDYQVEPGLAERWEQNTATNTYRFHLRRGVRFHDGKELGAEDVKYTFDHIAETNPRNTQLLSTDSTKVVDAYTVEVTPTRVNNRLVEQISHPSWGILRKDSDPHKIVGTGPFRLAEYAKNDRLVVERFDGYWNTSRAARAQRIVFRFVPDLNTRLLALRSGEVDIVAEVTPDATREVEGTPGLRLVKSGAGASGRIDFNIAGIEPYTLGKDPVVREAVGLAVDRNAVIQTVYQGNADTSPLSRTLFGSAADAAKGLPHQPDRARQLLDQAGWRVGDGGIRVKDGQRLSLTYLTLSPTPDAKLIGEVIQDQLRRVGIEIKIDPSGDAATTSARRNDGQYDLVHQSGSQNDGNPCFLIDLLYYSPEKGGRASNRFGAPGGRVDENIEKCRAATSIDEVRAAGAEAYRQLVDVERMVIPVGDAFRLWAVKGTVEGFVGHPGVGRALWEGIHLVRA